MTNHQIVQNWLDLPINLNFSIHRPPHADGVAIRNNSALIWFVITHQIARIKQMQLHVSMLVEALHQFNVMSKNLTLTIQAATARQI